MKYFRASTYAILILGLLISWGCSSGSQPIDLGKDLCALCKMTIMDKRFGAEIITSKGKIYKFDSAECMIDYIKQNSLDSNSMKSLYVIDHSVPGQLIDATRAFYLHSPALPSPMGANLSAVHSKEEIDIYFSKYGGEVWTWEDACRKLQ